MSQHPDARPVSHQYELAVLGEECGEVIQIVGKTLRFGYASHSPDDPQRESNLDLLHKELGDILAAIDFAVERGLLDREKLITRQFHKRRNLMQVAPPPATHNIRISSDGPAHTETTVPVTQMSVAHQAPVPTETPQDKRPVAVVLGILIVLLIGAIYVGMSFSSHSAASVRLEALRKAEECYATFNDSRCDELSKLAGTDEAEVPQSTKDDADDIDTGSARPESADDIVAGSARR